MPNLEIHVLVWIRDYRDFFYSIWTFALINFAGNNKEYFQTNSAVHHVNMRNKDHLHRQFANLSCFLTVIVIDRTLTGLLMRLLVGRQQLLHCKLPILAMALFGSIGAWSPGVLMAKIMSTKGDTNKWAHQTVSLNKHCL
jgi:hypothetical protein